MALSPEAFFERLSGGDEIGTYSIDVNDYHLLNMQSTRGADVSHREQLLEYCRERKLNYHNCRKTYG